MLADWQVRPRWENELADLAKQWRVEANRSSRQKYTNVLHLIETVFPHYFSDNGPGKTKGPFHVKIVKSEVENDGKIAKVSYNPLTLSIVRDIYEKAKRGYGFERFVLAHEIGHILLHDESAKAFSHDANGGLKSAQKERSAEWQANTFAYHLLLPMQELGNFSAYELATIYLVEMEVAEDFLEDLSTNPIENRGLVRSQFCPDCGHYHEFPVPKSCSECGRIL